MRKRIGIFGITDEVVQLIPILVTNPEIEIGGVFDDAPVDPDSPLERLRRTDPDLASSIDERRVDTAAALAADTTLHAVIDAGTAPAFAARHADAVSRGLQVVTPLTAKLLWGYGATSADRKAELLQTLHEVVESYHLTINAEELFGRMLEIARSVTGADGGSVMLLDPDTRSLRVHVAVGIEPELWPKIRVALGEGIAGRVAADASPVLLRGKADRQAFRIVRERLDVESAISVPLVHDGRVLGVLNLHHRSRPEAFTARDLEFMEQLARLDAQIIARAQEHEALRDQAARFAAVRDVHTILASKDVLSQRLTALCHAAAGRAGNGIASLYLVDLDARALHLTATSLEGGGIGSEYRVAFGQGVDGTAADQQQPVFLRGADGTLAYAALPLVAGDLLVGVLSIQAGASAPRGRAAEEILLELAAAAAEGIAQAQREASMAARATKISAINETGIRMISTTDPAELLRLAASSAAMVLEADHAILRLQDEETGRYSIRSYFGSADGRLQQDLFRLDQKVSVEIIKLRAPRLVRDLSDEPRFADVRGEVRSLMAAPLKRDGRVIGTLSLYDRVAEDSFTIGSFADEDMRFFTKFATYLEQAVASSLSHARTRQLRNFDEQTGLPNGAYLHKRVGEELARAGGRDHAVALAVCLIENLQEIETAGGAVKASRAMTAVADALRRHVRDFDVIGRSGDAEFTVLLPEPGREAGERAFALARAVADDVARNDAVNDPKRVSLAFGYALHPDDGEDALSLLEKARDPRIRMV